MKVVIEEAGIDASVAAPGRSRALFRDTPSRRATELLTSRFNHEF